MEGGSSQPGAGTGESVHKLEAQRRLNRDAIAALGFEPYGSRVVGLVSLAEARARYDEKADEEWKERSKGAGKKAGEGADAQQPPPSLAARVTSPPSVTGEELDPRPRVTVSGRVVLTRDNGKLIWMNLRDDTGDLQIAVSQRDVPEKVFKLAKLTDMADIVVATGRLMKTKTGEITVWCSDLRPGAKSLVPPPEKHAGLSDVELRYRHRYVDLWSNPETLQAFKMRSAIVHRARELMRERGFIEVETPMLQALAGGAAARPFVTQMHALGINLYMRIAPELYLKRLLVGGMPRVFEINRNFRNEGLDKQHNPEFTMMEAYEAYGDCETVMELTEHLVRELARFVAGVGDKRKGEEGDLKLPFGEVLVDYGPAFARVSYAELFERALGFAMTDAKRARDEAKQRGLVKPDELARMDDIAVVNELFEEYAETTLDPARPTFITGYPAALSPLTRPRKDDPMIADRADLFIGGMEIAPHYTELNDPDVQEAKFREQLRGRDAAKTAEESTFRTMDHDFLNALKVGMPPAGGMGLGIDRLCMLLLNQRTIRDVILFPLMRPEEHAPQRH